jgi:hypothetical protein
LDDSKLATTYVTDDVTVTGREVVEILILTLRCIEELKQAVALDVYCLDVDELVIRPLIRIRMRGSVFRNQDAVAVTDFAEQDITNNWCRKYLAVLPERCLG